MEANARDRVLTVLNERLQITYNELADDISGYGFKPSQLDETLALLEQDKIIADSNNGGIKTYYLLKETQKLRKVLIVEDDKNINRLMSISIGKNFEIAQIYDGGQAIEKVRSFKPDLVVLDLMLPHKDGLDICQTIKSDPSTKGTIVIIVSAMDPTSNRFKGIKYGADYYIRKPFNPSELRNLTTLFLNKKGKRFDPLIDLPNEQRISEEVEHYIREGERYTIGTLRIENLSEYVSQFGAESGMVILRLVSQLLQDIINTDTKSAFVGFLNSEEFVIAGNDADVRKVVDSIKNEFDAVLPFILQDQGYKTAGLDFIENIFESNDVPRLSLAYSETERGKLRERREEILKDKSSKEQAGSYTYNELQKLFGSNDLDIGITRDETGVKLNVGSKSKYDNRGV
jgi:DNA-binding response OmpR family regulator